MNRVTATLLTLALAATAWAGDAPTKEIQLPTPVVKAEDALNASVNKAYLAYLKTVEAEVKKAQAALEKEKQAATKAGNLELAMAIKEKQDALTLEAVVAKAAESGVDLMDGGGFITIAEGKAIQQWDNAAPYKMSPSPHDLSFAIKFDSPVAAFWFRAKPGYGCERISYTFDNGNPTGMARESEVKLKNPKTLVRVKGTHPGSNDEFAYGPLQYKIAPTDEWKDIPKSMFVSTK